MPFVLETRRRGVVDRRSGLRHRATELARAADEETVSRSAFTEDAREQLVERPVELPDLARRVARIAEDELEPARRDGRVRPAHETVPAAQPEHRGARVFVEEIEEVVAELVHEQADVRDFVAREAHVCARGPAARRVRVRSRRARFDPHVGVDATAWSAQELHAPERELSARGDVEFARDPREELVPEDALARPVRGVVAQSDAEVDPRASAP